MVIGTVGVSYQLLIGGGAEGTGGGRREHVADLFLFGVVNPVLAFWVCVLVARARQSTHLLRALDVASPDAFVRLDPNGRIRLWSRQAEALFDYSRVHVHGRSLGELFGPPGESAWLRIRGMLGASGLVRGQHAVWRDRNGGEVKLEISASYVLDDAGQSRDMLVFLRDVRDSRDCAEPAAQRAIQPERDARRLARAGGEPGHPECSRADLVSLALHEVRAPLAGIACATERIASGCDRPSATCERMVDAVRGHIGRLDGFAGQVLKAAQIEAGSLVLEREPTTVSAIVEPVVTQFRATRPERRLRVMVSPDLPPVYVDRDWMAQVMCNLLGNADKYSPADGAIEIEAQEEERQVRVSVRDYGPGLSAEALERAFHKFYRGGAPGTRAAPGYGLGLYISRWIVHQHGGEIQADNHPAGGAVFSFAIDKLP